MIILSHRGYWKETNEKNTEDALRCSLERGYGFESDVRDYCGRIVISHDLADENSLGLDCVLKMLSEKSDKYMFAINIKADGLKDKLLSALSQWNINNYFCFDMSVPQMLEYTNVGIRVFTRQSEYEPHPPVMLAEAEGVWIDAFKDYSWISSELLSRYIEGGKKVCIVSPELHQEDYKPFWKMLLESSVDLNKVILCTDIPDEARAYFGEFVEGE